ncbi:hypothetical protein VTK56DRAFT_9111 [Thermocarpiscus australiensis]
MSAEMGSTAPIALPALKSKPKYIFFTDFDGTITQQDSNDFMTDNLGFGAALRKKGNEDVLYGRRDFRDAFRDMLDSVATPFDQCIDILRRNITLDPGFKEFYEWARENNVPIVVLSGGMEPIIRALLAHLLGKEAADTLQIVSNDVAPREGKSINEEGGWQIVYHDDRCVWLRQVARDPAIREAPGRGAAGPLLCWRRRVRSIGGQGN